MNCIALYMKVAVGKNSSGVGVRFCLWCFIGFVRGILGFLFFSMGCEVFESCSLHVVVV